MSVDRTRSAPRALLATSLLTIVGALASPAVAHAACDTYEFAANFGLQQDNGLVVSMNNPDTTTLDNVVAQYAGPNGDLTTGHASGGINGSLIDFSITWDSSDRAGSVNHYTGVVGSRGGANGLIEANGLTQNMWSSQGFRCMTAPPSAPDAPNSTT